MLGAGSVTMGLTKSAQAKQQHVLLSGISLLWSVSPDSESAGMRADDALLLSRERAKPQQPPAKLQGHLYALISTATLAIRRI